MTGNVLYSVTGMFFVSCVDKFVSKMSQLSDSILSGCEVMTKLIFQGPG